MKVNLQLDVQQNITNRQKNFPSLLNIAEITQTVCQILYVKQIVVCYSRHTILIFSENIQGVIKHILLLATNAVWYVNTFIFQTASVPTRMLDYNIRVN